MIEFIPSLFSLFNLLLCFLYGLDTHLPLKFLFDLLSIKLLLKFVLDLFLLILNEFLFLEF